MCYDLMDIGGVNMSLMFKNNIVIKSKVKNYFL